MSDFWVGDWVKIRSQNKIGKYHGDASGQKGKVLIDGQVIEVTLEDLVEVDPPTAPHSVQLPKAKKAPKTAPPPKEIDLHLEVLDPNRQISQERMLDFQLQHCKTYVQKCLTARHHKITIIHGKGTGILKSEVKHYLQGLDQVEYLIDRHNGGATEVWLRYI